MPYAGQTWVDGVTPLDATHMNALDAGVVGAVDVDNVVAAASQIVANKLLATDGQPAFKILGDGTISWGPGGATAPDVSLVRASAGVLQTPNQLWVGNSILATGVSYIAASYLQPSHVAIGNQGPGGVAGISLGQSQDTNLYRSAAANLKTDGVLYAVSTIQSDADIYARVGTMRVQIGAAGPGSLAGIRFGTAADGDTNLYRSAASTLKTDGVLQAGGDISLVGASGALLARARSAAGSPAVIASVVGDGTDRLWIQADGKLQWGPGNAALDTSLSRLRAGALKAEGSVYAYPVGGGEGQVGAQIGSAQQIYMGGVAGNAGIAFGSASDTTLYRAAAGTLKTDGRFQAASGIELNSPGHSVIIYGDLVPGPAGTITGIRAAVDGTRCAIGLYAY